MLAAWIAGALVLGMFASRIGLPPLVGFLVAGFVLKGIGAESTPMLDELAHAGVLLLLFAVGLKLRLKTLMRREVWGTAITHWLITVAATVAVVRLGTGSAWVLAAALAAALGFSSTVLAAKALEAHSELRAVHGRIAIGILIVQDVLAVALLAAFDARVPSPYAVAIVAVPFLRPVIGAVLDRAGHGELLVLFGAALAIAGGEGFEQVGLSAELGALVLGMMLAEHKRAQELSSALWGLKEFFLVGFFLQIGFAGEPTMAQLAAAGWLLLLLPLKGAGFFALLLLFGLRARTSFLTAISLMTYSEFGLIAVQAGVDGGLLEADWLIVAAIAVAASFAVAAPLNAASHKLYSRASRWLVAFERDCPHPDDEMVTLGSAEILIVGMGRVGAGAYDYLRSQSENIVGIDNDPGKLEQNLRAGRRVAYADAEDPEFWRQLNVERLRAVMLAVPDLEANLWAIRELRRRGFAGLLSATHHFPEESVPILEAGCDVAYYYFSEAGVGFARHTLEILRGNGNGGTQPAALTLRAADRRSVDGERG
jgi:predicted Kef-type K+ transport protein